MPNKDRKIQICFFALFFLSLSSSFAEDPIRGTWWGSVTQPGYGAYDVTMTLDSASGGTIEYPSLSCGGTLSGGGSGGVYQYSETITYGLVTPDQEGCITGGSLRVVHQGEAVFWEWRGSYDSQEYYASGKLYRDGGQVQPGPGCEECGNALMNDIEAGLRASRNFRNYVQEARQNYGNCTQSVSDGCQNTCGRQLYDNLPGCDSFPDPGHKSCVETALRGARLSCP